MKGVFGYSNSQPSTKLFTKIRSIIISHGERCDRIRFLLPNEYMNLLTLVTDEQQAKIDKAIKSYTKGTTKCIEWQMVGVKTFQDVIQGYENYCDQNNTLFDQLTTEEHIEGVELRPNEIIFNLNGKKMNDLDLKWQYTLAYDLRKNDHMFHEFESVIIQTTAKFDGNKNTDTNKIQNKQKKEKKNIHKNKYKRVKKTNASQNNENIKVTDINKTIHKWDTECKEIQNEWQKRELEKCNLLDESFGILSGIEKTRLKLDKIDNSFSRSENTLIQTEPNNASNGISRQDILIIQNFLRLAEERLLKQELEQKERNMINESIHDKFENGRKFCIEQKKKEKDELNIIDKCKEMDRIGMELKKLILQIDNDKIIIEREWCIFNDIMGDTEWGILKSFISRILCNNINILKDTEEGMELRSATNEYDECFIYISHGKYGSTFVSSNYRVARYVQDNANNGCKSSLYVCMSSVNYESDINIDINKDINLVMLSGYLVCSNMQGLNSQRRVYDDCG